MACRLALAFSPVLVTASFASVQDVLDCKFEAGGCMKVINNTGHTGIAPTEETEGVNVLRASTAPSIWTAGCFGGALAGDDLGFLDPNLKGCGLETSAAIVWLTGAIGTNGQAPFPFPVPRIQACTGINLDSQAVLNSSVLEQWMASNALASSIGNRTACRSGLPEGP